MLKPHPIRVLLVQSDDQGEDGVRARLTDVGSVPLLVLIASELSAALERVAEGGIDVMLLELDLPDSQGVATFERAHAFAPALPIVVLIDDDRIADLGLTTVQGGAQDSLAKGRTTSEELGRTIRYAVERHRLLSALRGLALIDDLTGLYNGRGFTELGQRYFELARRSRRGGHLVVVDVDRLGTINEALGHHVGDRALRSVGDLLRRSFRVADLLARTTGDEFAVLAMDSPDPSTEALRDRIQEGVADLNARQGVPYQLSVSVGTADIDLEALSLEGRLELAREELRVEKRQKGLTQPDEEV